MTQGRRLQTPGWRVVALAACIIAGGSGRARACIGDCDGSGMVAINELVTLVNVALGTADPSACQNGIPADAHVNIALIIQAVISALNNCGMPNATPTAEPSSDVRGGSQAAVQASAAAQQPLVFSFGSVGAASSAARAGGRLLGRPRDAVLLGRASDARLDAQGAQSLVYCLNPGGTEQSDCTQTADGFLFSLMFTNCESVDADGTDVVRDGLLQALGPPEVCQPVALDNLNVTFLLTNYTEQDIDPSGIVTTTLWGPNGRFQDAQAQSTMLGCDGQPFIADGLVGDFSISVIQDAAVLLNRQYTYDSFTVAQGMGYFTSQTTCQSGVAANGALRIVDQLTGNDVSESYGTPGRIDDSFFIFTATNPDGSVSVNESGRISSPCFGDVRIGTLSDLTFPSADAACPVGGSLQVAPADGAGTVVQYSPSGVDFNGDGVPDVPSCTDPSLTQRCGSS